MNLRELFFKGGLIVTMSALGAGCVVSVDTAPTGTSRGAYESCVSGNICLGGTSCVAANYTVAGTGAANLCTTSCTPTIACPDSSFTSGFAPTCILGAGGVGQCYDTCASDADCGTGTRCGVAPTTPPVQICVPIGNGTPTGPTTVGRFQACDGSTRVCGAGSTCQPANVTPRMGNLCTVACTDASPCTDAMSACIGAAGTTQGQCLMSCTSPAGCPAGFTCLQSNTIQGSQINVCVPQ